MTRRRQLSILFPVGIGMALSLTGDLALYTILPTLAITAGFAHIGLLLSANRFIRFASNPIVGALVDRWGRRPLMLLGMGLGTLSTLIYALSPSFGLFLASRLVWGISWSLIYISAYCVVLDITDDSSRGWGSGVLQVFYFGGYIASPFLGGILNDHFGFSTTMVVCAVLTAIGFLTLLTFMPETLTSKSEFIPSPVKQPKSQIADWLALIKHPQISAASYLNFVTMFIGDGLVMSTIGLLITERYTQGASIFSIVIQATTLSGLILTLRAILSAIFAPFCGSISDKNNRPWIIIGASIFVGIIGLTMLIMNRSIGLLFMGITLLSLNNGAALTLLPSIIGKYSDNHQKGISMAIFSTAGDLGCALAPLASYLLLGTISLNTIYIISTIILATALPVSWIFNRTEKYQNLNISVPEVFSIENQNQGQVE